MKNWIQKLMFVTAASLLLSEVSLANTPTASQVSSSWKFRVTLDDTPIGYHKVRVSRDNNRKTVHTQASFDVRILFIPVYSYEHETRESWQDNCLVDVNSKTDDNGDGYFINSVRSQDSLELQTQDGKTALNGCVRTFAYWDVDLLKSERLLNTQTGKYESVSVTDMGQSVLEIDEEEIEARLFRLVAADMTIDLWYTDDMRWLALESVTESGAVLRYLPDNLSELALDTSS